MIDLDGIKERRAAVGEVGMESGMEYWRFVAAAPADIDALVAEVERLRSIIEQEISQRSHKQFLNGGAWRKNDGVDLQSCGHPRSAIVTADDLEGDGTGYCGMCFEEGKALTAQKSDWKLPDAPKCEHGETAIAAVNHNGDGWDWGWHTDCCGPDPFNWGDGGPPDALGDKIEWPFAGNFASSRDWELAGFEVM